MATQTGAFGSARDPEVFCRGFLNQVSAWSTRAHSSLSASPATVLPHALCSGNTNPHWLLTASPFALTLDSLPQLELYSQAESSFLRVSALIIRPHLPAFSTQVITSRKLLLGSQAECLSPVLLLL